MTQNALERVVEDLISESMAKGEFENLSGSGRPLPERTRYNPYMDFTSNKMNEILAEGGFAPEWIMLKKGVCIMLVHHKYTVHLCSFIHCIHTFSRGQPVTP